ncbi:hypothetical protein [Flavobacterium sp. PL02]|uniref:hypothetical protein n=1 Tax=Flavobacterium sp. PL02 TaxID=3088354 RepID=UPI002B234AB4|nr:hypothetical protein [Flavobacterium sp. PL02]MEA9412247.1 hypothetical protein [Flavobacterium sp. PL02]
MKSEENSKPSFLAIAIMALFSVSTLMMFLFIFDFSNNYKIIKHENEFKKLKVKIDSSVISNTRSGRSSSTSSSTFYYFNKGSYLSVQDTKGILFDYNSSNEYINEYMTNHMDSLNVWYLNKVTVKYAPEDQTIIDVSEEIETNQKIAFYFLIYIVFVFFTIKFKNRIFKKV